jgi:hypothetical protein
MRADILLALAVLHETMPVDSAVHCRMRMSVWVAFCQRRWDGQEFLEGSI